MSDIAEVILIGGRLHLRVAGFLVATEGDPCRDGGLPEDVFDPIPAEELGRATIGGRPAGEFPVEIIRFFRGDAWNERILNHVADGINRMVERKDRPAIPFPPGVTPGYREP